MKFIPWKDLDIKIVPLVKFLNKNGIETTGSCQGHKNKRVSLFPTQPWIMISRHSFKKSSKFLDKCLHKANGDSLGRLFTELINPSLFGFCEYYFVVFWTFECVDSFIERFKKLKNG